MAANKMKVAVVGGGINGICTGLALQTEIRGANVTVLSDRWTPETTGDVSAGFIYPYLPGEQTPPKLLKRIFANTIEFYGKLIREPNSGKFGVSLATVYELFEGKVQFPIGKECFPLIREMNPVELKQLFGSGFRSGLAVTTYMAEPSHLLPYLMDKFAKQGGKLVTRKVENLQSLLAQYDLVINCTGLGTKWLSDVDDESLDAVRGQIIRVKAPWLRFGVLTSQFYILPNNHCVILGGTKQKGNYDLSVCPQTAERILTGCCRLIPSLAQAEKVKDQVGLRPSRNSVRIEFDPRTKRIIHNYGHGGSGVTLCWGSALEVVELVREAIRHPYCRSKL